MFTDQFKLKVRRRFLNEIGNMGLRRDEIQESLEHCSGDLLTVMESYYGGMPTGDIGEYDFALLKKIAEFGLSVVEETPWAVSVPGDVILGYILNYRVWVEEIQDCREFFNEKLKNRISGKNIFQAALEVNSWCAEHIEVSKLTMGSFSVMGVLNAGHGNGCQASTFVVTAMRSVGIPARVVHSWSWPHCDGGAFWVEFWHDGEWDFLEPCLPEPLLGRVWFSGTASRAMLVSSYAPIVLEGEEAMPRGRMWQINLTARYTPVKKLTVTVRNGAPVCGAAVRFELLNNAEFVSLAELITDTNGRAELTLGLGCIHLFAEKDGVFTEKVINTTEADSAELDFLPLHEPEPESVTELCMVPPKNKSEFFTPLTDVQSARKRSAVSWAEQARKEYTASFYQAEKAEMLAARFQEPQKVIGILKRAKGNFEEIYQFLMLYYNMDTKALKLAYLDCLTEEDLCGVRTEVLAEHFQAALPYRDQYEPEIFVRYVMNPKILWEPLTCYRGEISSGFGAQGAMFRKDPRLIWRHLLQYKRIIEPSPLKGSPSSIFKTGLMEYMAQKRLFVAVCRTFGIPARINPVDGTAEYYRRGTFCNVEAKPVRKIALTELTLTSNGRAWVYRRDWSIAVRKDGVYETLNLSDNCWDEGTLKLSLSPGDYRILTVIRVPDGSAFCRKYCFRLNERAEKEVVLTEPQLQLSDFLIHESMLPFRLYSPHFTARAMSEIASDKTVVFVWLEPIEEASEQFMKNLVQFRALFNTVTCRIVLIVQTQSTPVYPIFARAHKVLPGAKTYSADFEDTAVLTARRLGLRPNRLPLSVVVRPGLEAVYACTGYEHGMIERLAQIVDMVSGGNTEAV